MYKIREYDVSLSPTIQSLTWHPFIFASISGRLPMLTPLGKLHLYAYAPFHCLTNIIILQLWYHATQKYHFHSASPTFSASRNLQKVHNAVLLSRTTNAVGLHLVVCPQKPRSLLHRPRSLSEFTETGRDHSRRDRERPRSPCSHKRLDGTGEYQTFAQDKVNLDRPAFPSFTIVHNHYWKCHYDYLVIY